MAVRGISTALGMTICYFVSLLKSQLRQFEVTQRQPCTGERAQSSARIPPAGQRYLRLLRIGSMHGFAVVAQSQLRESFRIADNLRPFRPRVAIGVQGHSVNPETVAALLELRGAVARAHVCKRRKQRPILGSVARIASTSLAKSNLRRLQAPPASLHPEEADDPVRPVDVLGLQVSQVRLRCAQVPRQLIKRLALRILFPLDDSAVFLPGDRPLLLKRTIGHCRFGTIGHGSQFMSTQKL